LSEPLATLAEPLATLAELRAELERGATSSGALVERAFARIDALEPKLHAFLFTRREAALAEAVESDARRARGALRSPLDGIPLALKDNIVQAGEPASCASRILEGYRSPFDATVVERLRAAGAVIVGRTNLDEFAMGSSTENSCAGPTRNPWDLARSPGGSSGGSAASVAAGSVPLALGSDTGGSIRQPAALCGVTGMKPSYGRVSRYGLVAFASSLDQIGPFGRSAADCAELLDAISGHDPRDSTSLPEPPLRTREALGGDVSGLTLGFLREAEDARGVAAGVRARVAEALAELERAGAKLREVALPHMRHAIAAYYLIATAEASSNLARYDGVRYGRRAAAAGGGVTALYERTRSEGFGAEVKRRILLGTYVLSAGYYDAYYRKAQQVRTLLRRDFAAAFAACDAIVLPTTPETAFRIGEKASDPLAMYLSDVFTVSANLAGLPGVSVPCGLDEAGLPVGLQILGRPLEDATVLRIADAYQRRSDHHLRRPPP
jgi:aspartyl-tRNA(Asn)/glutamyl-tRNA(Gln) amidotransferase subunit A